MAGGEGGKEGDWECGSCRNRNYAFRSFCNRCKQPRLLVDVRTPANSKWLPRIGDWICTGCTNNNYASREKCKKCGQPKEVAAMPAITIGGGMQQILNVGSHQAPLSLNASWPLVGAGQYGNQSTDPYGLQSASSLTLGLGVNNISGFPYLNKTNQIPPVPNGDGWRAGDWICNCGFHNYSSRVQCKKCNLPASTSINTPSSLMSNAVTALGTKRLASEEFVHNLDNKRQNAGQAYNSQPPYLGTETFQNPGGNQLHNIYSLIPRGDPLANTGLQVNFQLPRIPATPAILGKGATHWRDGDWMCSNCNNHNYASRSQCNRCKSEREELAQPVSVS